MSAFYVLNTTLRRNRAEVILLSSTPMDRSAMSVIWTSIVKIRIFVHDICNFIALEKWRAGWC